MAAELKDGDRAEGRAEGGLPQRGFGGQATGFCRTSLLGFKDLHAVILTNRCSGDPEGEVPQYHHRPSPGSMLALQGKGGFSAGK